MELSRRIAGLSATLPALLVCSVAWLALTEADAASWVVGAPTVLLAAALAAPGGPRGQGGASPAVALVFAGRLLRDIFESATRVAATVLRPRLDVAPGIAVYPLHLRDPRAQALFMNAVTLTPGTLSAAFDGDTLRVHALDVREDVAGALEPLEARVARLFGEAGP